MKILVLSKTIQILTNTISQRIFSKRTSFRFMVTTSLFTSILALSQSVYQNGFSDGFKGGYCYGINGCIAPVAPIGFVEVKTDYQTGYNNGFVEGQKRKASESNQNNTGGAYGQLKPVAPLNIANNIYQPYSQEEIARQWEQYYENKRIRKENRLLERENSKLDNKIVTQNNWRIYDKLYNQFIPLTSNKTNRAKHIKNINKLLEQNEKLTNLDDLYEYNKKRRDLDIKIDLLYKEIIKDSEVK